LLGGGLELEVKMAYNTFAEWNKTGLDQMFVYAADVVPLFIPFFLLSFFIIIVLASYFSSKRLSNDGDLAASFAVAGFSTFILALVMSLIPGLIPTTYVVIILAIAILGVLFLFFSKRR